MSHRGILFTFILWAHLSTSTFTRVHLHFYFSKDCVYFCHLWSTNCSAAGVFLQLHLDTEGRLHCLKHRWVHGDAVLRCEPEETWNRVLWLFLPRQQHLLWVLCKLLLKLQLMLRKVAVFWGDIWSSLACFSTSPRFRMTSVSLQTLRAGGSRSLRAAGANTGFVWV